MNQRKYHRFILLFCCIGNFLSFLYAQPENIKFSHLSIEHGLSQSSVYSIVQDDHGFIWIGTDGGLNKYDGYDFTVYVPEINNPNSLRNKHIISICKDHTGMLWIGTRNGLNRFDPATESVSVHLHDPADQNSISDNYIHSIYEDSFNTLWIGTNKGLNSFDRVNNLFIRYQPIPDNPNSISHTITRTIYEDRNTTLWIGTYGGGLNRYDRKNDQFFNYQHNPDDTNSLSDNRILCICEDRSGILWIGTETGGLNAFDREKKSFITYRNDPNNSKSISGNTITALYEDKKSVLWIGTESNGLNIFDRKNNCFIRYQSNPDDPFSVSTNKILSIFEDTQGGLWFGSVYGGLDIYNRHTQKFIHYQATQKTPNSLSDNYIWEIYEDRQGSIWIGTVFGGVNRFDREKQTFVYYRHDTGNPNTISHDRVNAIIEDHKGNLWFGTYGGLDKYDRQTERFTHYRHNPYNTNSLSENKIYSLYFDHSGTLWIGTFGGGCNAFDVKKKRFASYRHDPDNPHSISSDIVFCFHEDTEPTLWIGTFGGGLNKFNRKDGRFIHYREDNTRTNCIASDFILSMHEDQLGILWIGTSTGLSQFDKQTGQFTNFTKNDGLPDDMIYDIIEDDRGRLWLSTNRGLSQFDPVTLVFKNYDVSDGLQSNEFNTGTGCKLKSGEILFGGINGFNLFHPDSIRENPFIPPVVITEFQIFNEHVPIGKTKSGRTILKKHITATEDIILSYKKNMFSFGFAALNYVFPEENHYAYKMEGLEKKWNYVGNRRYASYTTLPPGKYVFRVKGSNNDGVWNEKGTSIRITITPPFWKTWWFKLCMTIAFISLILVTYRHRISQINQQKEIEAQQKAIANFSLVLEQGSAAVYRRRLDSETYDYIGDGIQDITGYSAREMTLTKFKEMTLQMELMGPLKGMSLDEIFNRMRDGSLNRLVVDFMIKTKSGSFRWVRDMITALHTSSGGCNACLGIMFDITDRKKVEEELARTSEELQEKNKEMEEDLNMACEIQLAFLAKNYSHFPIDVPQKQSAIQFNYYYQPATTLAGDYFDILPLSDHEVGLLICDVMGHGARASLLTSFLRGLTEELLPIAHDTALFFTRLNDGLNGIMPHLKIKTFATAFYCVADIKNGILHFSNAGHPDPFVMSRSDNRIEKLLPESIKSDTALGIHNNVHYHTYVYPIHSDDIIFFYTDGVFEVAGNNRRLLGKNHLKSILYDHMELPPKKILDSTISHVHSYAETTELNDDVCMVTMHFK